MKCPCGCEREVPNNRFWATDECQARGNKMGIYMPKNRSDMEKRLQKIRTKNYRLRKKQEKLVKVIVKEK